MTKTANVAEKHPRWGQLPESLLVFDPDEAADILHVSRASLYRRVRRKEWPHRILGDGVGIRFTAADLIEILEGGYVSPAAKQ